MHSFSTGLSTNAKVDNWQQLLRFFQRHGVHIPEELVEGTIRGEHGCAVDVLERLYQSLTGRSLPSRPYQSGSSDTSAFNTTGHSASNALLHDDDSGPSEQQYVAGQRRLNSEPKPPSVSVGPARVVHAGSAAQARRRLINTT